ncbi:MAG: hypothetical protein JRF63_08130 [Deltaproteobacteria bacterium]|nr:hypothetical protein [Deltaproteobacteria bacterium]
MRSEWEQELAREGLVPIEAEASTAEGAVACPACGTTAPLIDGACSDCGLALG